MNDQAENPPSTKKERKGVTFVPDRGHLWELKRGRGEETGGEEERWGIDQGGL